MRKYPPAVLVETWLFLARSHSPELDQVKLPIRRVIKQHFGSIELAQLYIELNKDEQSDVDFI